MTELPPATVMAGSRSEKARAGPTGATRAMAARTTAAPAMPSTRAGCLIFPFDDGNMRELPRLVRTTSWLYVHGSPARAPYVSAHITAHRNGCPGGGKARLSERPIGLGAQLVEGPQPSHGPRSRGSVADGSPARRPSRRARRCR